MFCLSCKHRIGGSAKSIDCTICKNTYHKSCIPGVHKYEDFYSDVCIEDWICRVCCDSILPFHHISDDDEFMCCLSEYWTGSFCHDVELLRGKTFTPLSWTPPTTSIDQCVIMTLISIITTLYVKHYPCATITWKIHLIRNVKKWDWHQFVFLWSIVTSEVYPRICSSLNCF